MVKRQLSAAFGLLLLSAIGTVGNAAPLMNGDFTSFVGWEGELWDGVSATAVDPATDPRFTLPGGGMAELSNDATFYAVVLFQTFDLPASAQSLPFDFTWDKTDAFDIVQANLVDAMLGFLVSRAARSLRPPPP